MSYVSANDRRLPKPKGIGMAVAVHVAVIAAVVAIPGVQFVPTGQKDINAFNIPKPPPPEPKIEELKPKTNIPRESKVDMPAPPTRGLPKAPKITPPKFTGSGNTVAFGGSGEGINIPLEPIDVTKPAADPVITGAQLNNRFASQFQPRYPSGMLRMDEEGVVSVRVLVGTDGRAKDIELISAPHPDFWDATRKHALRKWRFKAATKDGKPVESWITLKVRFEINT